MANTGGVSSGKGKGRGKRRVTQADWMEAFAPSGTYDPQILENVRAGYAGLEDLEEDLRLAKKLSKRNKREGYREIKRGARRQREDLSRTLSRGMRDYGRQREDVSTRSSRNLADFGQRIADLTRDSDLRGEHQAEAANTRGITGGGSLEAAAAVRRRRLTEDIDPIEIAMERTREDTRRALGDIGLAERDLRQDVRTDRQRLRQNVRQGKRSVRRDHRQGIAQGKRQLARQTREQRALEEHGAKQSIYNAVSTNPSWFKNKKLKKWGMGKWSR